MSEEDLLDQLSDLNGECVGLREKVEDLTAERDALKAEVEKILGRERETIRRDAKVMSLVCEDRDRWKSKAELLQKQLGENK